MKRQPIDLEPEPDTSTADDADETSDVATDDHLAETDAGT